MDAENELLTLTLSSKRRGIYGRKILILHPSSLQKNTLRSYPSSFQRTWIPLFHPSPFPREEIPLFHSSPLPREEIPLFHPSPFPREEILLFHPSPFPRERIKVRVYIDKNKNKNLKS
ncbi:MAG TPA: hypothetical protein VF399_03765 [bacterium]